MRASAQEVNQAVVELMGEAQRLPALSAKLDNERLRALFLTYCRYRH